MSWKNIEEAIEFLYQNIDRNWARFDFPEVGLYLGNSHDEKAFAPLVDVLKRGGTYIRSVAANGLGYLGEKKAIPYLIDAFLHDPELYVRCNAALGLGRLSAEEAIPHFLSVFPEADINIQGRIVMAIRSMQREEAQKSLDELTNLINLYGQNKKYLMIEIRREKELE